MDLRIQDIAAAAANRATFQRGLEYLGQHRVSKLRIEADAEHGGSKVTADVKGGKCSYEVEVSLGESGEILEGWCDCPAFYEYAGFCKHIVAVLLSYSHMKKQSDPDKKERTDSATDTFAARMLTAYAKRQLSEVVAKTAAKKVKLEPSLEYDYRGNFSLSLTVGHDRMYHVKSLEQFYADMSAGTTVAYGAKLTLRHDEGVFENASLALLRFFMHKYREFENMRALLGATGSKAPKRSMVLTPAAFDELFAIYVGRSIPIRTGYRNDPVLFRDENPKLKIHLQQLDDVFEVGMEGEPLIYFGEKNAYVLLDGAFYRCDPTFTAATRDFLYAICEKGDELVINREDMGAFCADVLGPLGDCALIDTGDCDLEQFEPEPLTPRLYLDMPNPGLVTASLRFRYGNTEIDALDEKAGGVLRRDLRREYIARAVVDRYIGSYDLANRRFFIDNEDKIYTLLSEGISEITNVAEVYTTDSLKHASVKKPPTVSVGVRLSGGLIDLDFDTGDFPKEELLGLLNAYRMHKRYHKLKDGTFISLENSALSDVSELVEGLDLKNQDILNGSANVRRYRAMFIDSVIHDSELLKSDRDPGFKAMLRDVKDVDDADIQPPQELKPILRNYQKKGFRWLKTMSRYGFGGILADDMGLGKTLEAIAFIQSIKDEAETPMPSLVVCPASLVLNWESEIGKFAPRLRSLSMIGNARQRTELSQQFKQYDVIITSYELLKRDIDLYEGIRFDCEILDEAQFIKNANTQSAKAVKSIDSVSRFALTGTPIENSLAELWSIFDFLMPGYLYAHHRFREDYEIPVMRDEDEQARARLKKLTAPFILRRLKSTVLKELPPKTETVLYTQMEGEQQDLYRAALAGIQSQLTAGAGGNNGANRILMLSMLTRLRQICCDPSLCFEDYAGGSAKLELCMELLLSSTAAGHKVLLFSQFTSMLSIIEQKLAKAGVKYFVLRGSTSKEERARLISLFNADDTQVFLISLRAGGTGLNLTAADIVIHYDPWWNLSVQNQATDRAHRIGQKNPVQVYKLIVKDTVEEKIIQLQDRKLRLAEETLTDGESALSGMSGQELLELFRD